MTTIWQEAFWALVLCITHAMAYHCGTRRKPVIRPEVPWPATIKAAIDQGEADPPGYQSPRRYR